MGKLGISKVSHGITNLIPAAAAAAAAGRGAQEERANKSGLFLSKGIMQITRRTHTSTREDVSGSTI